MKDYSSSVKRSVLTFFLVFPMLFCFATTWYISPGGSDAAGNGTMLSPWKTLYKATQTVITAGDIIHVNAGTYTETIQCSLRIGVSIEGVGSSSIIKSSLSGDYVALLVAGSPEGTNGNQHISNLKFDGQLLSTYWAIWISGRSNFSMYDCTVVDFKDRGIIFSARDDLLDGPPNSVYATGNSFHDNIVNNCAAYNLSTGVYGRGCLNIGGQDGMLIYNNNITQTQRDEGFNGWPIKYCNDGYLRGVKIYNNILTKEAYGGDFPGQSGWDFCIELFHIQGLEISGNTIQGSIDLNYNTKGTYGYCAWIHGNRLSRTVVNSHYESGIIFEFDTETAIVENNILNNISSGIQFNTRNLTVVSNCTIRKNLISNLGTSSGTGSAGGILIISEGTENAIITNFNVYNNTITSRIPGAPWVGIDFSSINNGSANNINIRNNIVTGFGEAWFKGGTNTNMTNVVVTHNDINGNANGDLPLFPGGNPGNYTYNNNIYTNPLFVGNGNFTLQATSPCINAGVNVGLPYSGSAPDIGYAEFGSGGPVPIKLIDLSVREVNAKNQLDWTTATESNSSHFNIERSSNAQSYQTIGRVNASGFSTTDIRYSFTDAAPLSGINYYRLAMIDKDASMEYSKTVSITHKGTNATAIIFADLSAGTNTAKIVINSATDQTAGLTIIDAGGMTILNYGITLQKGSNTINKSIPGLSKGIYYIRLFTPAETVVKSSLAHD